MWMGARLKQELNQDHIAYGADTNAQQGITLPDMQKRNDDTAQNLGKAEGGGKEIHILQAIDHQHTHNGIGEYLAQICNNGWNLAVFSKNQKWRESGDGGDNSSYCDDQDGMKIIHDPYLQWFFWR